MRIIAFAIICVLLAFSACLAANSEKNFGGVGIVGVPLADGEIEVSQLVTGGPAHLAGIKPKDVIVSIDGKKTKGSDFQEMVNHRLRGKAGTKVLLVIRRPGAKKPLRLSLTRRQLLIPAR